MGRHRLLRIALILIVVSAGTYALQIALFHNSETTLFNALQDLAFMPLTILIATVLIGDMINRSEKDRRIERIRMLESAFFSDMGDELIWQLVTRTENEDEFWSLLHKFAYGLTRRDIDQAVEQMTFSREEANEAFNATGALLERHRQTMYHFSANTAVLEHDDFTDMLWALFHFGDEIGLRKRKGADEASLEAMQADIRRVMKLLLANWFTHMEYTKREYPYFYDTSLELMYSELRKRFSEKAKRQAEIDWQGDVSGDAVCPEEDKFGIIAENGGCTIISYRGSSQRLEIPAEIEGLPVRAIGEKVFLKLPLTEVKFPDTLREIGEYAFRACRELRALSFPPSVTKIGTGAFSGCAGIETIRFGAKRITFGENAFYRCKSITRFELPPETLAVPDGLVGRCLQLTEVKIHEGCRRIGKSVFWQNEALERVYLPSTVNHIHPDAFNECGDVKVIGWEGSYAEKFCRSHGIAFETRTAYETRISYEARLKKEENREGGA